MYLNEYTQSGCYDVVFTVEQILQKEGFIYIYII